jgi:hypothetical protein
LKSSIIDNDFAVPSSFAVLMTLASLQSPRQGLDMDGSRIPSEHFSGVEDVIHVAAPARWVSSEAQVDKTWINPAEEARVDGADDAHTPTVEEYQLFAAEHAELNSTEKAEGDIGEKAHMDAIEEDRVNAREKTQMDVEEETEVGDGDETQVDTAKKAQENAREETRRNATDKAQADTAQEAQVSTVEEKTQKGAGLEAQGDIETDKQVNAGEKTQMHIEEAPEEAPPVLQTGGAFARGEAIAEEETRMHADEGAQDNASRTAQATDASSDAQLDAQEQASDNAFPTAQARSAASEAQASVQEETRTNFSPTAQDGTPDSTGAQLTDEDEPARTTSKMLQEQVYLGDYDKRSKGARQLAVTRCLDSVSGGSKRPWRAYPGHTKLVSLDMDLNGTQDSCQYHSINRLNADIKDWLDWRLVPVKGSTDAGTHPKKPSLKILLITLHGGESASSTAKEDSNVLQTVFEKWNFPTAALSVLLDRRTTCDQRIAVTSNTRNGKRAKRKTTRVYFFGMKQWSMVWSADPSDKNFSPRAVVMCLDKTWASSVPGVIQQYFKVMWMFLGYQGILPLVACMASIRYASSALAEDDKEAFRREYELRAWLKDGFATEKRDLGYTSAQVSWLSSRVSRQQDRLLVVNRMLGISKENLDIYDEKFSDKKTFEVLQVCIGNLADMMEQLRIQARQLEAQADVQLAALFNLINQADSAAAIMIARTSQSIADDSRRDQKISVDIANSSRLIALNTLRDSASMKAIAHVTMVFLPGTFLASVFAMPFFDLQNSTRFFVNKNFWIYVAITVPLTIATLALAWIWYHFSARSQQRPREVDFEENQHVSEVMKLGAEDWANVLQASDRASNSRKTKRPHEIFAQSKQKNDQSSQPDEDLEKAADEFCTSEHWDPMTREFAPSIFGASSFAFTEATNVPSSSESDTDWNFTRNSRRTTRKKSPSPPRHKPEKSKPKTGAKRAATFDYWKDDDIPSASRKRAPTSDLGGYPSPRAGSKRSPTYIYESDYGKYASPKRSPTYHYGREDYAIYKSAEYNYTSRPRSDSMGSFRSGGSHRNYGN